jgi:hypothetical protein
MESVESLREGDFRFGCLWSAIFIEESLTPVWEGAPGCSVSQAKSLRMMAGDHDHHPHTGDDARDGPGHMQRSYIRSY